jgi:hypothetical protein
MGAPQSSIARLESRQSTRNLDFVRRVADALDCTLEVRFVPKKHGGKGAIATVGAAQAKAAGGQRAAGAASGARRKLKA